MKSFALAGITGIRLGRRVEHADRESKNVKTFTELLVVEHSDDLLISCILVGLLVSPKVVDSVMH